MTSSTLLRNVIYVYVIYVYVIHVYVVPRHSRQHFHVSAVFVHVVYVLTTDRVSSRDGNFLFCRLFFTEHWMPVDRPPPPSCKLVYLNRILSTFVTVCDYLIRLPRSLWLHGVLVGARVDGYWCLYFPPFLPLNFRAKNYFTKF